VEHTYTVGTKDAGERIDKYLCRKLPNLSRKQIKTLLDGGRVSVGRRRVVIASWELTEGDDVEVRIPPGFESRTDEGEGGARVAAVPSGPGSSLDHEGHRQIGASIDRFLERQNTRASRPREERREAEGKGGRRSKVRGREGGGEERVKVYYQDRDVIVVEKPAGIVSSATDTERGGKSLQKYIRDFLGRKFKGSPNSFVAPLHRLDAETSGVMVFALSKAGQKLSGQFKNHRIERTYRALVAGRVERENGVIDQPLEKGDFGGGKKVQPSQGGMKAVTEYRVVERYADVSLVELRVRTGRTHQIRVHLASIGHPVLGDALYATGNAPDVSKELGFKRHALHAHLLSFKHPENGKKISYRSPLPPDMEALIARFRESV
jgi:23S rRNA pseudouridine1911/1915/1917 synthase